MTLLRLLLGLLCVLTLGCPTASPDDAGTASLDVPSLDVPSLDVPSLDVPALDVPTLDVPALDVPSDLDASTDTGSDAGDPGDTPLGIDDADGDTIADEDEGAIDGTDTDADGTPDHLDEDSDGDGVSDRDEAGDADPSSPPVDTDTGSVPDYRDLDSDDDGLSDATEVDLGTSRTSRDTDGDGTVDLAELLVCPAGDDSCAVDARDPARGPAARGTPAFFLPFGSPAPEPVRARVVVTGPAAARLGASFVDDPSDFVDAGDAFVDRIEAVAAGDAALGCVANAATDTDGDLAVDTFTDAPAGARLCFDVVVKANTTVPATAAPQLYGGTLVPSADGLALTPIAVWLLVPPGSRG